MIAINQCPSIVILSIGIFLNPPVLRAADSEQNISQDYVSAARKSIDKMSSQVESLQDSIVEELTEVKEKSLFRLADQVQSELSLLDKALTGKNPSREILYAHFDRTDSKLADLVKATSKLAPKRPAIVREVERIRVQNDDLHFLLSVGDGTTERQRQVLVRQAKSMKTGAKQFAVAADFALLESPGRVPFIAAVKKYAEQCEKFEKLAGESEIEKCKKDFSTLTDTWGEVVRGFRLLRPRDDYHIARLGFRVDQYHRRLFELLKMPGNRPQLTMNL